MRIGLFGGRFDPIHWGHLRPVQRARAALALDRVLYLPTATPPHRGETAASPLARYVMTELALLDQRALEVSSHELTLGRPAYTADTVDHFAALFPDAELVLVVGADAFTALPSYRRFEQLVARVTLAVLARPGWQLPTNLAPALAKAQRQGRVHPVDHDPIALSASEIRRRFACGEPVTDEMVPARVLDYVRKYGLYR